MPMFGVTKEILAREDGSASGDEDFFSVASTIPFVAGVSLVVAGYRIVTIQVYHLPLMPSAVTPWLTAFRAYSTQHS